MPSPYLRHTATATILLSIFGAATAAELTVEVRGITRADGAVLVALYDSTGQWLRKPLRAIRLPAQPGRTVRGSFGDLPPGSYAISTIHDRNGNGQLDANGFGIPTEPYAFSNDASGFMGPARFEQARFAVGAEAIVVIVDFKDTQ